MLTLSDHLAEGFTGGPSYATTIIPTSGGKERRNRSWPLPKRIYRFGFNNQPIDDCWDIEDFFHDVNGRATVWLMPDFTVALKTHNIGTGDGADTTFQARIGYGSSSIRYVTATGIKPATLAVYANGTPVTVSSEVNGLITLAVAPAMSASVTAAFTPLIPVRFDTDECIIEAYGPDGMYGRISNLTATEVR